MTQLPLYKARYVKWPVQLNWPQSKQRPTPLNAHFNVPFSMRLLEDVEMWLYYQDLDWNIMKIMQKQILNSKVQCVWIRIAMNNLTLVKFRCKTDLSETTTNEIKEIYQRRPIKWLHRHHEAFSNMAGESTLHYLFSPIILPFLPEFKISFLFQILIYIMETAMKTLTTVSETLLFVIDPVTSAKMLRSKKVCQRVKHHKLYTNYVLFHAYL